MICTIANNKVITIHDYLVPPIPNHEWSARWDCWDVCEDPECMCRRLSCNSVGHGETEDAAIADLVEQTEERAE